MVAHQCQVGESRDRDDAERDARADHRQAPPRRDGDRAGEQRQPEERQHDAERAHRLGGAQGAYGEAALLQFHKVRIDAGRDLPGEVRRERAQRRDHHGPGVGEVEGDVAAAIEQQPVGMVRRGAHNVAERWRDNAFRPRW